MFTEIINKKKSILFQLVAKIFSFSLTWCITVTTKIEIQIIIKIIDIKNNKNDQS